MPGQSPPISPTPRSPEQFAQQLLQDTKAGKPLLPVAFPAGMGAVGSLGASVAAGAPQQGFVFEQQ